MTTTGCRRHLACCLHFSKLLGCANRHSAGSMRRHLSLKERQPAMRECWLRPKSTPGSGGSTALRIPPETRRSFEGNYRRRRASRPNGGLFTGRGGRRGPLGGVPRDEDKTAKTKSAWRGRGGGAHSIVPRNRNSMGNVRSHDLRRWLAGRVPSRRAGACCRPGPAEFPGEGPVPQHGPAADSSRVRTWDGGKALCRRLIPETGA